MTQNNFRHSSNYIDFLHILEFRNQRFNQSPYEQNSNLKPITMIKPQYVPILIDFYRLKSKWLIIIIMINNQAMSIKDFDYRINRS